MERTRWQVTDHATGLTRLPKHQLFVTLSGTIRRTSAWIEDGHRYDGAEFAGATTFIPSGRDRRSTYRDGVIEYAAVRLDPALVLTEVEPSGLEFPGFTNRPDPLVERLTLALGAKAERPAAATLLRVGSNVAPGRWGQPARPLAAAELRQVLDYIQAHLAADLRLEVLARLAGTDRAGPSISHIAYQVGMSSQSHLTTAFRRGFGTTPRAYRVANTTR